jgi:hypothetical protein
MGILLSSGTIQFSLSFSVRLIFLIGIVGGWNEGPLDTAATSWPIVPAPGDYDDEEIGGMMIGRGNRSTRRKPAPVPLCPPQIPHAARTRTRAAAVGSQRLTNRLSYGTAFSKVGNRSNKDVRSFVHINQWLMGDLLTLDVTGPLASRIEIFEFIRSGRVSGRSAGTHFFFVLKFELKSCLKYIAAFSLEI